ncbi:MAG TPA: ABATE domain-containing protein [Lacipirellulaceae bacterium]|nr:ABATE domain-containing protein [Lacipirellulaceae bacterium]
MPTLAGNALALDFANSVDDRGTSRERDFLPDLVSFRAWCRKVGLQVADDAKDAGIVEVHDLRDAIAAVAQAAALERSPPPDALALVNRHLPPVRLAWTAEGFALETPAQPGSVQAALATLAQNIVDLLAGPRRAQLRICERPGHCDWVFLDTTRNHSRKYCTDGCAITERVARHTRRSRGKPESA